MHLMGAGEHGDVVAPVVGGGPEAMHQEQGGTPGRIRRGLRLGRPALQAVHGMALMAPGIADRLGKALAHQITQRIRSGFWCKGHNSCRHVR